MSVSRVTELVPRVHLHQMVPLLSMAATVIGPTGPRAQGHVEVGIWNILSE